MTITVDRVIETYIANRNKIAEIEGAAKEQVGKIKEVQEKLEAWLKAKAAQDGVDSFKTSHGTAFLTTSDSATVAEWDTLLNFVRTTEAWDFVEKRVSKAAVKAYLDQHKQLPPGVNYTTRQEINVRKAAAK